RVQPDVAQSEAQQTIRPTVVHALTLQVCARGFEQLAVLDAGRARALASATAETAIDVLLEGRRVGGQTPFLDGAHQIDAPARPVVLVARVHIRRASLKAQPAMHTRKQL